MDAMSKRLKAVVNGRSRPFSDTHRPELAAAKQSLAPARRQQPRGKLAPGHDQHTQPLHELQRRHHQVGRPVAPRRLELELHLPGSVELHPCRRQHSEALSWVTLSVEFPYNDVRLYAATLVSL